MIAPGVITSPWSRLTAVTIEGSLRVKANAIVWPPPQPSPALPALLALGGLLLPALELIVPPLGLLRLASELIVPALGLLPLAPELVLPALDLLRLAPDLLWPARNLCPMRFRACAGIGWGDSRCWA